MLVKFDERFKVIRELDRGAFGTVYSATDMQSGGRVAVKVLHMPSSIVRPTTVHPSLALTITVVQGAAGSRTRTRRRKKEEKERRSMLER